MGEQEPHLGVVQALQHGRPLPMHQLLALQLLLVQQALQARHPSMHWQLLLHQGVLPWVQATWNGVSDMLSGPQSFLVCFGHCLVVVGCVTVIVHVIGVELVGQVGCWLQGCSTCITCSQHHSISQ